MSKYFLLLLLFPALAFSAVKAKLHCNSSSTVYTGDFLGMMAEQRSELFLFKTDDGRTIIFHFSNCTVSTSEYIRAL